MHSIESAPGHKSMVCWCLRIATDGPDDTIWSRQLQCYKPRGVYFNECVHYFIGYKAESGITLTGFEVRRQSRV